MTNIRNGRRTITIIALDIKKIIKEYSELLYTHKYDNLDKMGQFLESYILSKLTIRKIENQTKPIPNKEIEPIINNFLKQKATGPDGFTDEF